ncbi:glycosyltransferase family 4 protein [Candidatus Woesearchaeota archaeon]|jgi:1,2-diacylglycerol 3-alpha-glucosyltransferase|nr:glycosyltransferase family 4 protein [Candidatus Woesearchaeota archaeon]
MSEQKLPKLLITTDSFLPRWDGIARFLQHIIPKLAKQYEITIICPKFEGVMPEIKNVRLVRVPLSKFRVGDFTLPKFKHGLIKKYVQKTDLVWSQTIGPIGLLSMALGKRYNKKVFSYVHSIEWELFSKSLKYLKKPVEYLMQTLVPFLYNKCDAIMIPYPGVRKMLKKRLIFSDMVVVPLGTEVDHFNSLPGKRMSKKLIGIKEDKFVIGYVGRIGREKDLDTLYRAFRKFNSEYANSKLVIVGGGVPLKFENMQDIILIGSTSNVLKYYQAFDVYVLPSLTETTSLTTMEAMSCELPVIVTPVGYLKEYIKHRENGLVFPQGNSDKLNLFLKKLIKDRQLRMQLGKNARKTIVENFTWDKTVQKVEKTLKKFISKK